MQSRRRTWSTKCEKSAILVNTPLKVCFLFSCFFPSLNCRMQADALEDWNSQGCWQRCLFATTQNSQGCHGNACLWDIKRGSRNKNSRKWTLGRRSAVQVFNLALCSSFWCAVDLLAMLLHVWKDDLASCGRFHIYCIFFNVIYSNPYVTNPNASEGKNPLALFPPPSPPRAKRQVGRVALQGCMGALEIWPSAASAACFFI